MIVAAASIFRNEAENIPDLFASARGLVDVWIVVDTGSTDGTIDAARREAKANGFVLHVLKNAWDDDFARSRNVSLDLVDTAAPEAAFVIVLDGDDRFDRPLEARDQLEALRQEAEIPPFLGIRVDSPTHDGRLETFVQIRVFARKAKVRYIYPVHGKPDLRRWEDPDRPGVLPHAFVFQDCRILHQGYGDPVHWAENLRRTLRILRAKMDPDHPHRLGYEARALLALGEWDEALAVARRLVAVSREAQGRVSAEAAGMVARGLLNAEDDAGGAARVVGDALADDPAALDGWTLLLQIANRGLYKAALNVLSGANPRLSASLPFVPAVLRAAVGAGAIDLDEDGLKDVEVQVRRVIEGPFVEGAGDRRRILLRPRRIPEDDPFLLRVPEDRRSSKVGLRVLVVATREIARQGALTTAALNRHSVHAARMVLYERDYLAYGDDDVVLSAGENEYAAAEVNPTALAEALELADRADVLHFIRPPPMADAFRWIDRVHRENALIQYFGSDVRGNPTAIRGFHDRTGILGLSAWDPTMLDRAWMPYHVPILCDVDAIPKGTPWEESGLSRSTPPEALRIAHPTTRRAFKRTDVFVEAVAEANRRGAKIEADVIEGVSNVECLRRKALCHATFDQLSVGIYGYSAVESMAMGHAVIGGISAWALSVRPGLPIILATERTLAAVLVHTYEAGPSIVALYGRSSKRWAREVHGLEQGAERLSCLYAHVVGGGGLLEGSLWTKQP